MQLKRSVCLIFLRKSFVVSHLQIQEGYAAWLPPRLAQKSAAQPLAFYLHRHGLASGFGTMEAGNHKRRARAGQAGNTLPI